MKEETLDEKKLSDKDVKRALASAKAQAKPKETVSLKKPPFKMDEEVEQIDELSKDTLRSYNDKSKKSSKELGAKLDSAPKDLTGNFRVKDHPTLNKLQNRVRGQRLAHGRLTSEEVNKDFIVKAIKPTVTDDTSIKTIADIKPLRMKLAHFRHHE